MRRYLACCFDKRVLIGLGVVVAGVIVVAPRQAVAALPAVAALVCPLSMLVMMRGRNRGGAGGKDGDPPGAVDSGGGQELARLRREVAALQAARAAHLPGPGDRVRPAKPATVRGAAQDSGGRHGVAG